MKTITFDYTKKDGSTSERVLMVVGAPTDKYSGVDLSELDPTKAAQFVVEYETLHSNFMLEAQKLQAKYDLKHSYRQFFESGMKNIIEL